MRKVLIFFIGLVVFVVAALVTAAFILSEPKPDGKPGPEAEAFARRLVDWTKPKAWAKTGAVRWTFGGRFDHLWDRQRGYARVRWEPYEALLRLEDQTGVVRADGLVVADDRAPKLLKTAYGRWVNDSFWLNPFPSILGDGVEHRLVETEERGPALLVTYPSGGLTPGDSYLWFATDDGQPTAYKMWVSIIPIGGVEASWDDWIELTTGAKISTLHRGPIDLRISNVAGAASLSALLGDRDDPFAGLEDPAEPRPTSQPSSRPSSSGPSSQPEMPAESEPSAKPSTDPSPTRATP